MEIKPSAILVDVDGTISIRNGRGPFEWHLLSSDVPFLAVTGLINDLVSLGQLVIFVSSREERLRPQTLEFIEKHIHGSHLLLMRPNGDSRPDDVIKREIFLNQISENFNIRFVLEDRDQVVKLWRTEFGLPTFQVNYGNF